MTDSKFPAVLKKTEGKLRTTRKAPAFLLATLVSGLAWYYQNRQVNYFSQAQEQVINRVQFEQSSNQFLQTFDYTKAKDWEGVKVNLDGILHPGRFIIKRKRGDQDGYIVLAPFSVSAIYLDKSNFETMASKSVHRKLMLNLGWIPKSSKHQIPETCAYDIIGNETYTYENRAEALEKQEKDGFFRDPLQAQKITPLTNVTAYIRLGEHQDRSHGYFNDNDQRLFKFIDLPVLCRLFRIQNKYEGERIYLQRTAKSEEEYQANPIPANKELVVEQLRLKTKEYTQNSRNTATSIAFASFGLAGLFAIL